MTHRDQHEEWLLQLTSIPTAAGREHRVIEWVERWVARRRNLKIKRDPVGNLLITQTAKDAAKDRPKPLFITAHLDHPAFVVRKKLDERTIELEFRGGVHDAYFDNARIEIIDERDAAQRAVLMSLDPKARPFKRAVVRLEDGADARPIKRGDVARWVFDGAALLPVVQNGILHAHACDDLAAVAAALAALDVVRTRKRLSHVGVLLTVAEEVGFVGAIGACKHRSVPRSSRLICLENSRSFAESPIGGGPILRVGDRISVFEPRLTNRIGAIMLEYQKRHPEFRWQRKLMPGGACEATTFSSYGYESTCICLPLGNYHNMTDIDGVAAGKRPARVGPEQISVDDYHGMIAMLVLCAERLDSAKLPELRERMEVLFKRNSRVLQERSAARRGY